MGRSTRLQAVRLPSQCLRIVRFHRIAYLRDESKDRSVEVLDAEILEVENDTGRTRE